MSVADSVKGAVRGSLKTAALHGVYPMRYRQKAAVPVNPSKVVFLEVRQDTLSDSFLTLYAALEAQKQWQLVTCTLEEGMKDQRQVAARALAAIDQLADARWILVNDSSYLLGCLPLRRETEVIQLWHACGAFKKFGYSIASKTFGSGMKQMEKYPLYKNFSYVTVSSREVTWAYAEAFGMQETPEKIVPTGISRTDRYYDPALLREAREKVCGALPAALAARVREARRDDTAWQRDRCGGQDQGRGSGSGSGTGHRRTRIALYAPTFRGKVASATSPSALDLEQLRQKAGEDWILLIKHHPFVKHPPAVPASCENFAVDVTGAVPIETLLMAADVCITDYSSLAFEYALMNRPMLFFAPDLKEYTDWRGFYYPYEEMTPGPVVTTTAQVAHFLEDPQKQFDPQEMAAFREKFMGACDGHATQRILTLMGAGQAR